ncbi:hypothetical protein RRG08_045035 [Elysia crispata]|uniref:Uncharacterized protein n=1 Tax=Elysia crispata TaxID=231223 RepID=A0AAE0ZFK2_9GAST|nr:hypothetical protein RRG08_045035 [Elysia crispata]
MDYPISWRPLVTLVFLGLHCYYGNIPYEPDELKHILDEAMMNGTWVNLMLEEQRLHELNTRAARAGGGESPLNMLFDYRGNSWRQTKFGVAISSCIGGDQDYDFHTSMPNILREYSQDLYGYSKNVGDFQKNMNEAIIGARSRGFAAQARWIVTKLRIDPSVDFENDWKLITVFLGGNDLCIYCLFDLTSAAYTNNLRKGLDILYNNVPRAFVNLVVVMQVGLTQILHNGLISTIMLRLGCPCGAFPRSGGDIEQLAKYTEAYQQAVLDLAESGDYDSDTFTVVAQTFFQNMTIPYNVRALN